MKADVDGPGQTVSMSRLTLQEFLVKCNPHFLYLTFTSLWDNSADDKLVTFFLFFPGN